MRDDSISVRLGISELRVVGQKELGDRFEVRVMYRREYATCPRCGIGSSKEHDRRVQRKQDRRLRDKQVLLMLVKRRFRCYFCGKVFTKSRRMPRLLVGDECGCWDCEIAVA